MLPSKALLKNHKEAKTTLNINVIKLVIGGMIIETTLLPEIDLSKYYINTHKEFRHLILF